MGKNVDLKVEELSVDRLISNPKNARTHSKKQIGQIVASIREFGFVNPVLVDEHDGVIAGHGRLAAARQMGRLMVPAIRLCHLDEARKRAFAIADNKIALNAGWDLEILAAELCAISDPGFGLEVTITGFETTEIDGLLGDMEIEPSKDPAEEVPEPEDEAVTRAGDLWVAGNHRIICGDATGEEAYARLFPGRELAAMIITDPPYNVPVNGHITGRGKARHKEFAQASGEMSEAQFEAFLREVMALLSRFSTEGSLHYLFMDWRHIGEILAAGKATYDAFLNMCVWTKTNAGQGSFYRSAHELVFLFRKGETQHTNNVQLGKFGRNRSNVWPYAGANTFRAGRMEDLKAHPTVKPVAMIVDAIKDATKRGEIVLDAFLGSGTTTLAAEKTGRRCFGIEIEPKFVDVAIRRWQAFTGKDAILEATGQTFDDVMAERVVATKGEAA